MVPGVQFKPIGLLCQTQSVYKKSRTGPLPVAAAVPVPVVTADSSASGLNKSELSRISTICWTWIYFHILFSSQDLVSGKTSLF